jgi:flagellar motor switch protein FliM
MSSLNLTEDEIEALRQGIEDGSIHTSAGVQPRGAVGAFALGSEEARGLDELHALQLLNERVARGLRAICQPLLRAQPRVIALPAELKICETYLTSLAPFLSLNIVRMEPLRGNGLVVLEPELIGALVDAYFGGKGEAPVYRSSEFTPAEERIVTTVMERMFMALEVAWEDVAEIKFGLVSSESHPQFAAFAEDKDEVVVTRFSVQLPRGTSNVDIVYPLQSLRPVMPSLRSKVIAESAAASDPAWGARWKKAVLDTRFDVRTVLAEPVLTLGEVARLRVGDIIPIQVPEEVQLLVERTPFRTGTLGEAKGAAAIMVNAPSTN